MNTTNLKNDVADKFFFIRKWGCCSAVLEA